MIPDSLKGYFQSHKDKSSFTSYSSEYFSKKICVIGLGYIGLPTAALLASRGFQVVGVDIDKKVVKTINKGKIHIVEPDLDVFVHAAVDSGRLKASTEPEKADVYIICVPTPFQENKQSGNTEPDLSHVLKAADSIAPYIKKDNYVILESTSPVGATEKVAETIKKERETIEDISIAYCPERVLPGRIMQELVENDRIVGGINNSSTEEIEKFYKSFVVGEVFCTDSRTAEMCKLLENSSRDVQIGFANELSMICDKLDIDVWELIDLANKHPRVDILKPGPGVGGHCIAVDPWFIIASDPENTNMIRQAREINNYKTEWVIEKIRAESYKLEKEKGEAPVVACMGLSFKPNIDDLRESPALKVYNRLKDQINVIAVEPNLEYSRDIPVKSIEQALEEADILAFLVAHEDFRELETDKKILDFCGVTRS